MKTKDAYEKKIDAQLEEWEAEISKLKAKAKQADAQAQIELDNNIDKLEERKSELKSKLNKLKEAGEGGWEDIKKGVENASAALSEAFSSARSRFN